MPATEKTFKKKRLFKVQRELNVSQDRVLQFLEDQGYDLDAVLSGKGLNASIVEEEAYQALMVEYAEDAEAASRLKELRSQSAEDEAPDPRGEVTRIERQSAEDDAEEDAVAEEDLAAEDEEVPAETAADTTDDDETAAEEEEDQPVGEAEAEADVEAGGDTAPTVAEDVPEASVSEKEGAAEEDSTAEEAPTAEAEAEAAADATADAEATTERAEADTTEEPDATTEEPDATASEEVTDEAEAVAAEEGVADDEQTADAVADAEADAESEAEATAETADEEPADADDEEAATAAEEDPDEAVAEGEAEGEDSEEAEDPASTLKADRYKLKGTSVVGKLDLSKFKKRRRKRKRKTSDDGDSGKSKKQRKDRSSRKSKKGKKGKKSRKPDEQDVEETLQETLRELEQGASRARQRRRRRRRERHAAEREAEAERAAERENVLRVTEFISTGELANLMGEAVNDVISALFDAGMMVSINQRLDADTISFIADEYDYDVEFIQEFSSADIEIEEDAPEDLEPRAPVVTVMGHVDHGKTSLLDYIREENVVAGEAGGITQHVGAHYVELPEEGGAVTFLDTPGHEAFTAMRARGAQATDVVVLVVAADDAVMPQTREAINHAQAADVPLVVAINKMDLPDADEQKVMAQLAEQNVIVEQYGGKVQCALVSAETGDGVDDLLEKIALEAELRELTANPDRMASGVIIESRLEKGRGNVVTVLVQNGTLKVGDPFIAGIFSGRVRAMFDERDNRIDEVGPSKPALILGSSGSPEVGDQFVAIEDEGEARDIAQLRQQIHREQELRQKKHITLDEIGRRLALGEFHELNLVIKADVGGSVEALSDSLLKLTTEEVAVNIVHSGVGAITESDIMLASASDAVIIGFQVRPTGGAREAAEREEIDVRNYSIIYDAIEDVHDALEGLLSPEEKEKTLGTAEVRELFKVPKVGTVAGCRVTNGRINRKDNIRVIRDGVVIYEGQIGSLKHVKDDVREVQNGYECGLSVENFNDVKVGDELEAYEIIEVARTLETT